MEVLVVKEINIDYLKLCESIRAMSRIESGLGYQQITQCYGRGGMATESAELCIELSKIEKELLAIVRKTNTVLKNAGIDFANAERTIISMIDEDVVYKK